MARKKKGRPVSGILVVDKPSGITSNAALQKVKWLFQAQKAGHTGSLDPLATGVLPICLGEATKVSHYLLDANKRYRARCVFGTITTTGDSEGEIIATQAVPKFIKDNILTVLCSFEGEQTQVPPMYSALKHNGRPLYELARKGIEVERKSRQITIFEIKLLTVSDDFIDIEVLCSKGTYIRTLCEDIGQVMGCGAHMSALRRLESGPFSLSQTITLVQLTEEFDRFEDLNEVDKVKMDQLLLATDCAIENFPILNLDEKQFLRIKQGQTIEFQAQTSAQDYRLYYNSTLIGLGILQEKNSIKPKRLLFL